MLCPNMMLGPLRQICCSGSRVDFSSASLGQVIGPGTLCEVRYCCFRQPVGAWSSDHGRSVGSVLGDLHSALHDLALFARFSLWLAGALTRFLRAGSAPANRPFL